MKRLNSELLFALLRSAVSGRPLEPAQRESFSAEQLPKLAEIAQLHDIAHLVALALQNNGLVENTDAAWQPFASALRGAVYRCERMNRTIEELGSVLETARIPFVFLKGAVLREMYPEKWMRTSGDVDVLVQAKDLQAATAAILATKNYTVVNHGSHDIGLKAVIGTRVELHYDLVEPCEAKNASRVLQGVWEQVTQCEGWKYRCEMTPAFFCFYHIAHMAKHFTVGGCGIRTFLDIWVLSQAGEQWISADALLEEAGLKTFARRAGQLSRVWFDGAVPVDADKQMEAYILRGGTFGTTDNRVAVQQSNQGGRMGYFRSRVFASRDKLERYYPVLKKHPWLLPVMQVRRWLWLLRPSIAQMAKRELAVNRDLSEDKAADMQSFMRDLGLQ